jgi:hypothetical protein
MKNHTNLTEVTQMKVVWEEPDTAQRTLSLHLPHQQGVVQSLHLPHQQGVVQSLHLPHQQGAPFILTTKNTKWSIT